MFSRMASSSERSDNKQQTILVTPRDANLFLAKVHEGQRRISESWVDELCRVLRDGEWIPTPDPIIVDENGFLMNGMHRLRAISKAGIPAEMRIEVANVNVMRAIDAGRKRQAGSVLMMEGRISGNATNVASAAKKVYMLAERKLSQTFFPASRVASILDVYPNLPEWCSFGTSVYASTGIAPSTVGAVGTLTSAHPADSRLFFTQVRDGVNLQAGHPALALRRAFSNVHTRSTSTELDRIARVCRAWNAYAQGQPLVLAKGMIDSRSGDGLTEFPWPIV